MQKDSDRWKEVNHSRYPWEREGLAFIRDALPDAEPYRAWANVEFVADDGTINEIDLFVLTRTGAYLVELKGHPGRISGDNTKWLWTTPEGKKKSLENPLPLTRRKCHRLENLLKRQSALRNLKGRNPLQIEPIVFLSSAELECQLNPAGRSGVYGRGIPPERAHAPALPNIIDLLTDNLPAGQNHRRGPKHAIDTPLSKAVAQAFEQANIRPSTADRRIGDYDLVDRLGEGIGWEDWQATHRSSGTPRRVRRWLAEEALTSEVAERLNRAARREFDLLSVLNHPSILLPADLREHQLGPALVFPLDDTEQRLDVWVAEHFDGMTLDTRLRLLRDIAEALAYAHRKGVYHRSLSPGSVRVCDDEHGLPSVKIADWQTAARPSASQSIVAGTTDVRALVAEAAFAYLAPEELAGGEPDPERADVFALGALAYLLLTGAAPADDAIGLRARVRDRGGLDISEQLDAPIEIIRDIIVEATNPNVVERTATVRDFLAGLDLAAEELAETTTSTTGDDIIDDPLLAEKGDLLPGGWRVDGRLGKGSTAVALLVTRDGREEVWKVALDPSHDSRLRTEHDVLQMVKHKGIVTTYAVDDVGPRTVLHLEKAGNETLSHHLRTQGRLELSLLERWGNDLLDVIGHLEDEGMAHRDIKPDNLGVKTRKPNDELHLVLFDFSLARTPAENLRAGTPGYLDPFLEERPNRRWDWQAERWSVAVTLYEMATGARPHWPGGSDPAAVPGLELEVERDLFDPAVADSLAAFFTKALQRDPTKRFDTVEDMQKAWSNALAQAGTSVLSGTVMGDEDIRALVDNATRETALVELGLTPRALDALGRLNLHTVGALTDASLVSLQRMRGVGDRTRKEIASIARLLQDRFAPEADETDLETVEAFSIDRLYALLYPKGGRSADRTTMRLLLEPHLPSQLSTTGHGSAAGLERWPGHAEVAGAAGLSLDEMREVLERATNRWKRIGPFGQLRVDLHEALLASGGVAAGDELAEIAVTLRGSAAAPDLKSDRARAVVRAVIEIDQSLAEPRWTLGRAGGRLAVTDDTSDRVEGVELADLVLRLGDVADELVTHDPLPSTSTVLGALRAVSVPPGFEPLPDVRLIRLAAAGSSSAATSSRLDLYPRGMSADRAIRLARPVLLGPSTLSAEAVRDRVRARFPEAATLPGRPQLDHLLSGIGLTWENTGDLLTSGFKTQRVSGSSLSEAASSTRLSNVSGVAFDEAHELAVEFDRRLQRLAADGGFCALNVEPGRVEQLELRLQQRHGAAIVDVDDVLISAMRSAAQARNIDWDLVEKADSRPGAPDWTSLKNLVSLALPDLRRTIVEAGPVVALTSAGLLDRYGDGQVLLLDELRDHADGAVRIDGALAQTVLLVVPSLTPDARPKLGASSVPVITSSHWATVPKGWFDDRVFSTAGGTR